MQERALVRGIYSAIYYSTVEAAPSRMRYSWVPLAVGGIMLPGIASIAKSMMPWWARIPVKIALSAAPVKVQHLKKLGLFHFGDMDRPEYALRVFDQHFAAFERFRTTPPGSAFTSVELGPGDSLFSAIIARARGALQTYLVDAGDFAQRDIALCRAIARQLGREDLAPEICQTVDEVLAHCSGRYLTSGLASLRTISSASVDFLWSHAVLHAVRSEEFGETIAQLRRVMRPGGVCSHEVDLRDMLGGSLNHLRFSDRFWESRWTARTGFYGNRIRFTEMMNTFGRSGFSVISVEKKCWQKLPVARSKMAGRFGEMDEPELLVHGFQVVLRAN